MIEELYSNTKLYKYLIRYGAELTSHVMQMVNTVEGATSLEFFKDFDFFYYLFPKINLFNKKMVKEWFIDEFDKENKEYKRIEKMFEYISNSLCGIRKNYMIVYDNLLKFCEDLEGFDRTGEYYEV